MLLDYNEIEKISNLINSDDIESLLLGYALICESVWYIDFKTRKHATILPDGMFRTIGDICELIESTNKNNMYVTISNLHFYQKVGNIILDLINKTSLL